MTTLQAINEASPEPDTSRLFVQTAQSRRRRRSERLAKSVFLLMAVAMVVPLLLLLSYLVVRAWPSLNLNFVLDVPRRGMTEGGIWPALVGTLYLVLFTVNKQQGPEDRSKGGQG